MLEIEKRGRQLILRLLHAHLLAAQEPPSLLRKCAAALQQRATSRWQQLCLAKGLRSHSCCAFTHTLVFDRETSSLAQSWTDKELLQYKFIIPAKMNHVCELAF